MCFVVRKTTSEQKHAILTNGSRLEMVGSPRSIGGFHGVQVCSKVFQSLSLCSLGLPGSEVNDAYVGS
jgi:hypothetical protein